jgi:aspartyl-tRNA(Asn)/glutamyl-tRNA(Gln) amidotransferase subunit C
MSAHDESTVRRVATLARLEIDEDEARRLGAQFAAILDHFRVLSELDVGDAEPMTSPVDVVDVLRDDVPLPSLPADLVLRAAPRREGDQYAVPKTVGPDAAG